MEWFFKIFFLILAYLIGSIPFGFIFGKLNGVDVREVGSKNIGATNTGRAIGFKYAVATYICDMFKGAIIVFLFRFNILPQEWCLLNPIIYGLAAVLGHTFPIYLKFKGGKSVACGSGAVAGYCPLLLALAILVFSIVVLISKYVSLGSLCGAFAIWIGTIVVTAIWGNFNFVNIVDGIWQYNLYYIIFTFIMMIIVYVKHHSNIKRLLNGTERKIGKKKTNEEIK